MKYMQIEYTVKGNREICSTQCVVWKKTRIMRQAGSNRLEAMETYVDWMENVKD